MKMIKICSQALLAALLCSQLTASSSDLAAALQLSMRAVQHENVDVRIHALTSLKDMMHSKQVLFWLFFCDSEGLIY